MRILAVESYFGGSHRAFIEGWRYHSRHHFELLTLPPRHFKWRMRQAAVGVAADERLRASPSEFDAHFDVLWASSILNLAELVALAPLLTRVPKLLYFHENQLAYPVRHIDARDVHFSFTNWISALAADEVWFNSEYNRDSLLEGLRRLLAKMPDQRRSDQRGEWGLKRIEQRSRILPPGVDARFEALPRARLDSFEPLRLVWAARWEYDKGPEEFFAALELLHQAGVDFRLSVVGSSFREVPAVFAAARRRWASRIDAWGYQPDAISYRRVVQNAHVVVSSAEHEFFGLSVMEAALAGCAVVAPRSLAYPELFGGDDSGPAAELYTGGAPGLARALVRLAREPAVYPHLAQRAQQAARGYLWSRRAAALDDALELAVKGFSAR